MKIFPASQVPRPGPPLGEMLRDVEFCQILIALLLHRIGEVQVISQADLDLVAGLYVVEGMDSEGNFLLDLTSANTPPEKQQ